MTDGDKLNISRFESQQTLIRLHPSFGAKLRLSDNYCTCVCGLRSVSVFVEFDNRLPQSSVQFSSALFEGLLMKDFPSWVAATIHLQEIHVGPVIGVLCNPVWGTKSQTFRSTKQLPTLEKLVESAQLQGALCIVFRLADVDFQNACVLSYTLEGGRWVKMQTPLPESVYDQVISRKVERSSVYTECRRKLSEMYGQKIFNDGFFDKWQVHEWLRQDQRLRKHVPETIRFWKTTEAVAFVQRFAVTYFKPVHGSLGLGIIRLTRTQDGPVYYDIKRRKQIPLRRKASSSIEAIRSVEGRLRSKPYLIQQGVSLALYQERPFDIRILLQRDGTGKWCRTKMFARIAQQGDITSNLSSGGEALPVDAVLQVVFTQVAKRRSCFRQIRRVANLVTEVVEREGKHTYGELGIDLGIDDNGDVWIIEINSKPWKSPTTEKGRQDLVDLAFSRPIQYAIYLTRQT